MPTLKFWTNCGEIVLFGFVMVTLLRIARYKLGVISIVTLELSDLQLTKSELSSHWRRFSKRGQPCIFIRTHENNKIFKEMQNKSWVIIVLQLSKLNGLLLWIYIKEVGNLNKTFLKDCDVFAWVTPRPHIDQFDWGLSTGTVTESDTSRCAKI